MFPFNCYLLSASVDDIKQHRTTAGTTNSGMLKEGTIFQNWSKSPLLQAKQPIHPDADLFLQTKKRGKKMHQTLRMSKPI